MSRLCTRAAAPSYGSAFIADQTGALVAQGDRVTEGVHVHTFDLDAITQQRDWWGIFRDRRPEMYRTLLTSDGDHPSGRGH